LAAEKTILPHICEHVAKLPNICDKIESMDDVCGALAAINTLHAAALEAAEAFRRLAEFGALEGEDDEKKRAGADLQDMHRAITRVSEHLQLGERSVRSKALREAQERSLLAWTGRLPSIEARPPTFGVLRKDAVTSPMALAIRTSVTDHSMTASFEKDVGAFARSLGGSCLGFGRNVTRGRRARRRDVDPSRDLAGQGPRLHRASRGLG
jgi:hypothetical protein